jgi:RimJ/RimL family protein N-acetyltransferase
MTESPFQSQHVSLRPFESGDVPALAAYLNHPALAGRRYLPWGFPELAPLSEKQVDAIYQKWAKAEKGLQMAVSLRATGQLVGHAGCDWGWDPHCPDLSVVIAPSHQRLGYGTQALELLLGYLFGHTAAHTVSGWVLDWNEPARQFADQRGFHACGRMRRAGIRKGQPFDALVLDMLQAEWQARKGGRYAA